MKLRDWLEKWEMTSLKLKTPYLDMNWEPKDADKDAAWELYVELLTRTTTQPIDPRHGDDKAALNSIYMLFPLTREVIRRHGRDCREFTKLAVVILNQVVRPFTSKWHRLSMDGTLEEARKSKEFRKELKALQIELRKYTKMLADMADVEDLTVLEK